MAETGERYELFCELATGGMATVYLGRLNGPDGFVRAVAIKCMHPHYAKDAEFASMFKDEARLAAQIRHPNVVPTLDVLASGGQLLHVMEYVHGEVLLALLRAARAQGERVPVPIASSLLYDVLCGLHAAHEAKSADGKPLGVVHRDVSPHNVLVGADGLARLIDFGVAKAAGRVHATKDGEIKGKVPYMPPEQLWGGAIDRRTDVYAASVVLWEVLAGRALFDGASEGETIAKIVEGTVAPPSAHAPGIDAELDRVVLKGLARDPDQRWATAHEMAQALEACARPAPRLEVAEWVARVAGPALARRSEEVRELEGGAPAMGHGAFSAALGGPSALHAPARTSRAFTITVLAAAIVAVSVTALATASRAPVAAPRATPAAPAMAAAAAATNVAPPLPAPSVVTPEPTKTPPHVRSAPAPRTSGANCRPPYTLDENGRRHYKIECL